MYETESQMIVNPDYLTPENVADLCCNITGTKKRKNSKGGFKVCCPAHDDKNPSLNINPGDKGTLIYCQTGCTPKEIMAAIGRKESDLFQYQAIKPRSKHASLLRTIKNTDNTDNTDNTGNTDNTVTNPRLKGLPRSAIPRNMKPQKMPKEITRALFEVIRHIKFDTGLQTDAEISNDKMRTVEAWRIQYAQSEDKMKIKEQAVSMWTTAKTAISDGAFNQAVLRAKAKTPKTCPTDYRDGKYETFFGICYYLAERETDGIFYTGTRRMADALELREAMYSTRMFRVLLADKVLKERPEFKSNGYKASRYQLNPDYSSDPSRKDKITVASWHRYTFGQVININPSSVQKKQVEEIKAKHNLNFDTLDFCRRGNEAHWKTDYGKALNPEDMEAAVLSFIKTTHEKLS